MVAYFYCQNAAEREWFLMLTKKQQKVLELSFETDLGREQIASQVGVSSRTVSRWRNENEDFAEAEKQYARKTITNATSKALGTMIGLLNARSEMVRFNAAKDLLDRAGFAPTEKVDLNGNDINIKIGDGDG